MILPIILLLAFIPTNVDDSLPEVRRFMVDMVFIVVIILASAAGLLIIWIYRGIAIPLGKMKIATQNIKEGNLDFAPEDDYYGEVDFRMQYKQVKGDPFDWIYIDFCTLSLQAAQAGFQAEKIAEGEHFDYLARLTLK